MDAASPSVSRWRAIHLPQSFRLVEATPDETHDVASTDPQDRGRWIADEVSETEGEAPWEC